MSIFEKFNPFHKNNEQPNEENVENVNNLSPEEINNIPEVVENNPEMQEKRNHIMELLTDPKGKVAEAVANVLASRYPKAALYVLTTVGIAGGAVYGFHESLESFKNNPQNIEYQKEYIQKQKDKEAAEKSYIETKEKIKKEIERVNNDKRYQDSEK